MRTSSLVLVTLAVLGTVVTAQNTPVVRKVNGPITPILYGVHTPQGSPEIVYENTMPTGFFGIPGIGEEWIDHAVIVGNNDHDTIIGHEFGYATYTTPATVGVRLRHYPGYTGFCGSLTGLVWDVSITGLPGGGTAGAPVAYSVAIDMSRGNCFFADNGPFGYSVSYNDSNTGPLFSSGGTGNLDRFDWTPSSTGSCGSVTFGGTPYAGIYSVYTGHDGNDSFGVGCGPTASLSITGPTCPSGVLILEHIGPPGSTTVIGIGDDYGAGIGGPVFSGPCLWDISLLSSPPWYFFPWIPYNTGPISVGLGAPPPGVLTVQIASRKSAVWSTTNVGILHIP